MTSVRNAVRRGVRGPARNPQDTEGGGSPVAPTNTVAPVIVGLPGVGVTLVLAGDTWAGTPAPTFTYQWKRDGGNISGATSATYQLQAADIGALITCTKTGTNGTAPDASADTSNSVGPVVALPVNNTEPVASATAVVGQTATCSEGDWTGAVSLAYQWYEADVLVPGATLASFLLSTAGVSVYCAVTATNTGGSTSQNSNAIGPVGLVPQNITIPTITGTGAAGSTLTCSNGTWSGYPASLTFTRQWYADDVALSGETAATLLLTAYLAGKLITCEVVATNATGDSIPVETSNAVGPITSAPFFDAAPIITGTPAVGETLTATTPDLYGYPVPTKSYEWRENGLALSGETGSTFTLGAAQEGDTITVAVTATNTHGSDSDVSAGVGPIDPEEPDAGEWDLIAEDGIVLIAEDGERLVAEDYTDDLLHSLVITPKAGGTTAAFGVSSRTSIGTFFAVVLTPGSDEPLDGDIEDWATNPASAPAQVRWSTSFPLTSDPDGDPGIYGLTQDTADYMFRAVIRISSEIGHYSNVIGDEFTTLNAAPIIANPKLAIKTSTSIVVSWDTTDQTGDSYVGIYLQSESPENDAIIAGTGAQVHETKANSAVGIVSFSEISGLPPGTPLRAHILQVDNADNESNKLTYDFETPASQSDVFQYAAAGVTTGLTVSANLTTTAAQTDPLGGSNAFKAAADPNDVSIACTIGRNSQAIGDATFTVQFYMRKIAWASSAAWARWQCTSTEFTPSVYFSLDGSDPVTTSTRISNFVSVPLEDDWIFGRFDVDLDSGDGSIDTTGNFTFTLARSSTTATIQTDGEHSISLFDYRIVH